jgi:phosphatidylserine/phosphatidylglycerophosphate/cardiolipin synthase-like enzyme/regulation of enolase protein 1 (concanavalin A-like superfamily)
MKPQLKVSLFLLCGLSLLIPTRAAAQPDETYVYSANKPLCDVSYQECRQQIRNFINGEPAGGSIDVAFWFMEDARYKNDLIAAKNRGVRVRILFDTEALSGTDNDIPTRIRLIDEMSAAGIPMRHKSTGGILHWKLMIFGKQEILNFSAANFSPVGYVPDVAYRNYEDEVIAFEADASLVASFKSKFDDIWTSTTGYADYANITTLERYHPKVTTQDSRLNFPPTQNYATRAVSAYDKEMVGIDVDMYRITDARHADAMIRAVQRIRANGTRPFGEEVRLYTEPEQYRNPTRLWHSYNVDRMYMGGVKIKHRAHDGLNHQKSVILHGQQTVIFGSSNWTSPSANSQLEHNLFTTDNRYFDFFTNQFNRKWDNTHFISGVRVIETTDFIPLPPDVPKYVSPATGATGQNATGVVLKWIGGYWAHKYDIRLGTTAQLTDANRISIDLILPPDEKSDLSHTFAIPAGTLQAGTTYYWQIVSKTMADKTKTGPVWSFTTAGTPAGGGQLPAGWSTTDVGGVGAIGSATYETGSYLVSGSGADIWGTADEFRFVYTNLTGDGSIVARVAALSNENAWTKAGVMMRDGFGAGAAHGTMFVSSSKGLAFQRRTAPNGLSTSTAGPFAGDPYWVRMSRSGNVLTAAVSADNVNWTTVGSQTIAMGATIQVGLALTSHLDGTLSTATFDNVSVGAIAPPPPPPPPPPGPLPSGWTTQNIGATTPAGGASFDSTAGTFSVTGAGADVWGTADAFRYAYTTLDGDGEISARVDSLDNVDVWTKAGVMIRDGLSAGAAHATMFVSPTTLKGTAFQRRPAANGTTVSTPGPAVKPPYWVKLIRMGTAISAYTSPDGSTWTLVGTETIPMGTVVNAGLAVTSHKNGTLATGTFSSVTVTEY